jgi:hypothetical protein
MVDRYAKAVLTVIAAALVALVIQEVVPKAIAQSGMSCEGTRFNPCYVAVSNAAAIGGRDTTLSVTVK